MLPLVVALAAVAVACIVFMLTFATVKKWFQQNQKITNPDAVNVLLKQRLKSGKYKTIGCVFDTKTENTPSATAWQSDKLDEKLEQLERVSVLRDLN